MHKVLDDFEFWPDPTTYCGGSQLFTFVTHMCPKLFWKEYLIRRSYQFHTVSSVSRLSCAFTVMNFLVLLSVICLIGELLFVLTLASYMGFAFFYITLLI